MFTSFIKILFFATMMVAGSVQAATYYGSEDSCDAAWRAGKAEGYKPTAKNKKFGEARVKGFEKRKLEGDACALLGAQPGKKWVFLKEGTEVYTKGAEVKFLAECQNNIYEIKYLKKEETVIEKTVTTKQTVLVQEVIICVAYDGKKFPAVNGQCIFQPVPTVAVKTETKAECTTCTPTPKVNVVREEKSRVCGIAVLQSLENKTIVARLQLDEDQNNPGKIRIAKVKSFEGVAEQVAVSPFAHSNDCNVDQATVYQNWPAVVRKFNLPDDCIPKSLPKNG